MRELYVFCEGATEQGFCKQVLAPHLFPNGEGILHTIKVANNKRHGIVYRGGILKYASMKRDIQNTLKSRPQANVHFTTLIDLFGLPQDFPGKANNLRNPNDPTPYALAIETAFGADVGDVRFLPHVQLHEYETMLFANPNAFSVSFDQCDSAVKSLEQIAADVRSIELINDGPQTAPSKRIIELIPQYDGEKVTAGPDIAELIGIPTIRAACPHFDQWLKRLESLYWGA
jgi:Domain of unknown function (DUF4276)